MPASVTVGTPFVAVGVTATLAIAGPAWSTMYVALTGVPQLPELSLARTLIVWVPGADAETSMVAMSASVAWS